MSAFRGKADFTQPDMSASDPWRTIPSRDLLLCCHIVRNQTSLLDGADRWRGCGRSLGSGGRGSGGGGLYRSSLLPPSSITSSLSSTRRRLLPIPLTLSAGHASCTPR